MLTWPCLKLITGRASVMAIFNGTEKLGQVSVCGDAYRGCVMHLRQHLAHFYLGSNLKRKGGIWENGKKL